ncbi:uncharacterized protein N7506_000051, partial [Penicillium brevicompactum]|uniref:uncharacterized protein n=1 Tax=Penicillium brevicompactum TaxID=5074 RepID=UPI0025413A12
MMQDYVFTRQEMRIARERRIKYQGPARVNIAQIQTIPPLPQGLNPEGLERLRAIFRKDGCRRMELNNFVPVVVSQNALHRAMSKANISPQNLLNPGDYTPLLEFESTEVIALHGRHRLQVGSEILAPLERWWTVDIYLDVDIGADLKNSLLEEYSNENTPTDGQIYWRVRQYETEQDESSRQRWFVRLSKNKQIRLDQLDNNRNRQLREGFNRLLHIRGLWLNGLRISMLHRVIAATAIEEVLNYLAYIYDTYLYFVDGDQNSLKRIGSDTVNLIHLKAPGSSEKDSIDVRGMVLGGKAFGEFTELERIAIWDRLSRFKGLIPSLYSFFEDFKYLEACSHCVRQMIGVPLSSIKNTMKHSFTPGPASEKSFPIQVSERSFSYLNFTQEQCFDLAYRQVWLFAMRNYPLMPRVAEVNDKLLAKPGLIKADAQVLYDMAKLSHCLGFRSIEIEKALAKSPDRQIALSALLQARKPTQFQYPDSQLESLVTRVVECFAFAFENPGEPPIILADSLVEARARCGMPQLRTFSQDKDHLFLPEMHCIQTPSSNITTLFVRQYVYIAFFGNLDESIFTNRGPNASQDGEARDTAQTSTGTPPLRSRAHQSIDMEIPESADRQAESNDLRLADDDTTMRGTAEDFHETEAEVPIRAYSPSIYSSRLSELSEPSTIVRMNYSASIPDEAGDIQNSSPAMNEANHLEVQSRPSWTIEDDLSQPPSDAVTAIVPYSEQDVDNFRERRRGRTREVRSEERPGQRKEEQDKPPVDMGMTVGFLRWEKNEWILDYEMRNVTEENSAEVKEKAGEYRVKGFMLFDTHLKSITASRCYQTAKQALCHHILLVFAKDYARLNIGDRKVLKESYHTAKWNVP